MMSGGAGYDLAGDARAELTLGALTVVVRLRVGPELRADDLRALRPTLSRSWLRRP